MTDANVVNAASASDKPVVCFGRFMVDLPQDPTADIAATSMYRFGYIKSENTTLDQKAFAQMVEQRALKYRGVDEKKDRTLKQTLSPTPNSRIIVTAEEDIFGSLDYGFEMFKLDRGVLFSMQQNYYDSTILYDTVLPGLQALVLPNLRARRPDEIPTAPGLCIRDGFIASDGSERALAAIDLPLEAIDLSFRLKRWPDVSVSIRTTTIDKAKPSLLERTKSEQVPGILKPVVSLIKTVREGRHDVGSIAGEESLKMIPTDYDYKDFRFRWESHYELQNPSKPMIVVELTTGKFFAEDIRPTITEKEAVELFDAVVNSIRLRPTKPVKSSAAEPPKAPRGTVSTTGYQCPQSGLWCAVKRWMWRDAERIDYDLQPLIVPCAPA